MNDTDTPRFVLIMPGGEEFDELKQHITSSLLGGGMKPISWDEPMPAESIAAYAVQKAIELADLVIVDITGNNPNVLFEAGFALGARKPLLPIVQRTAGRVPSALGGWLYLVYDPAELDQLRENIKTLALYYLENRKA